MGDDFEAKARAFHRAYQRRNAIAFAILGAVFLLAGLGLLVVLLVWPASNHPEAYRSFGYHDANQVEGNWARFLVYAGGGIVIGLVLAVKSLRLFRNLDRPASPSDDPWC